MDIVGLDQSSPPADDAQDRRPRLRVIQGGKA